MKKSVDQQGKCREDRTKKLQKTKRGGAKSKRKKQWKWKNEAVIAQQRQQHTQTKTTYKNKQTKKWLLAVPNGVCIVLSDGRRRWCFVVRVGFSTLLAEAGGRVAGGFSKFGVEGGERDGAL